MRVNYIILFGLMLVSIVSCGGRNSSESRVVLDTVATAIVNLHPEYYFSGVYEADSDTAFFTENATGKRLGVFGGKITEELKQRTDSLFDGATMLSLSARGYLREVVGNGDTYECVYFSYIEKVGPYTGNHEIPLTGCYSGKDVRLNIDDDHSCHWFSGNDERDGEWFMSNDTLLYVNLGTSSYIFDVIQDGSLISRKHELELRKK